MGNDRQRTLLLAACAGLLAGLALPPLGALPLLWLSLAVLWRLAGSPTIAAFPAGLLWGAAAVLVSHRWLLWLHPLDWIGVPAPLSLPLCLLLWLLLGLCGGLLVGGWLVLVRRLDAASPAGAGLAMVLWGLAEVLLARGPLFWLGLGAAPLPALPAMAGLASWGGAGLVAAFQLLIGWCLAQAWRQRGRWRRWLLLALALALAGLALGQLTLARQAAAVGAAAPERLLLLQPAVPTRQKFAADQQLRLLRQLAAAQGRQDSGVASLLLPEGALALGQALPTTGTAEVLSGGFRQAGEQLRSSLLRFPPGERQPVSWVDKHRLVPLGEWVPLAGLWRWSGLSAVGGLEPGPPQRLLERPAGPIGVAICYELADGSALRQASRAGAGWLLASANLDPYPELLQAQFTALARLRAIENGRWLVSVANTGPSLVLDAAGRLRQQLPAGRPISATVQVQPLALRTGYQRWGEAPLLLLGLACGLMRLRY
jgi:apolipoprotein N-acyltransferase